nr:hypothetical protein [Tanacetum cinerariifolium]
SEEIARVLTSMDAATVLEEVTNIPTGSGFISTAGPPATIVSTGSEVGPTANLSLEKKIELISDLVKYQEHYKKVYKFQSQQRKPMSKKQKREYYMAVIKSYLGWRFKDFKGMSFEEIEGKFTQVWKWIEDFTPMGSKEEAERAKSKG